MGRTVRFSVIKDGIHREILKVSERGDQGLNVVTRHHDSRASSGPNDEQKFSIHPSDNARDGGFQVHGTLIRADGERSDHYTYVRPCEGYALIHLFTKLLPSLKKLPIVKQTQAKNERVVFADVSMGSIFYSLVAVRDGDQDIDLSMLGLTVVSERFSRYKIYVLAGVFHATPTSYSITISVRTHPSRVNGVPEIWFSPNGVPEPVSPKAHHLPYLIEEQIDFLSEEAKKRLSSSLRWDTGEDLTNEEKAKHFNYDRYSKDPSNVVITDRLANRIRRILNPPDDLWAPA